MHQEKVEKGLERLTSQAGTTLSNVSDSAAGAAKSVTTQFASMEKAVVSLNQALDKLAENPVLLAPPPRGRWWSRARKQKADRNAGKKA